MNVRNRACIRKLSFRSLRSAGKRNRIAIAAIALTAMLFTALFTIVLSMNASYQSYTFRQMGGYGHGTFKDVTEEQIQAISAHPKVKESGVRTVIGFMDTGAFAKKPAEVSYMDENCTRWSYAAPTVGRMPENVNEVAMDTKSIELLGGEMELNTEITLTYEVGRGEANAYQKTDSFLLVGYWEEDTVMPVHYINISRDYASQVVDEASQRGFAPFRSDLNVMMASSIGIRKQMEQVDLDLGYSWEDRDTDNAARIGVNWGITSEQMLQNTDPMTVVGIALLLFVILLTGCLIIYNIFQISVSSDIRYYGLLKTIGVTPRQLKRIIRWQAFLLSLLGIPAGLLGGYGVGALLTPMVVRSMNPMLNRTTFSVSPVIFVGAVLFSLVTVLFSCMRPARLAARVSPVEATRYTEQAHPHKKSRKTHQGGLVQMALANLMRKPGKTVVVLLSLALAVVLLNALFVVVNSFDMEKYLERNSCADFVVSSTDYFHSNSGVRDYLSDKTIQNLKDSVEIKQGGSGYRVAGDAFEPQAWMREERWRSLVSEFISEAEAETLYQQAAKQDDLLAENAQVEGLDPALFEKLTLLKGDLAPVIEPGQRAIAAVVPEDDYGNPYQEDAYPEIGETLSVTYVDEGYYIDRITGELCNDSTPEENLQFSIAEGREVTYTVAAHVLCPRSMGFRYGSLGYMLILPAEKLKEDSGQTVVPMFYLFDTPDRDSEQTAEQYLQGVTAEDENLMYESKDTVRQEFEGFQKMFLMVGGLLCAVISVIGALNYFNVIMTSVLSRKREFAILQAIGMTNKQLRKMLIAEGVLYGLGAVALAAICSIILSQIIGDALEQVLWFFTPHFTILPILITLPVFLLLGWLIPTGLYGQTVKTSVVERLREIG